MKATRITLLTLVLALAGLTLVACSAPGEGAAPESGRVLAAAQATETEDVLPPPNATPLPERAVYAPGELVEYTAQTGDTLPGLAARFNTSVEEILTANPIVPESATTLPPGLPMQIPVYYVPFWGTAFQILPDSHFVNGPAQVDFDVRAFLAEHPGWLSGHREYAADANRTGAEIIETIAQNFSVSPRLLIALLEHQAGALSEPVPAAGVRSYPLGYADRAHRGLYLQLSWAADLLNDGYYRWRDGTLTAFELEDGRLERPDPWQNAATVALQGYFARLLPAGEYEAAISVEGLASTYARLFGDPWADRQDHIPGSLLQPEMTLPFEAGEAWAYTGGPHTAWGEGAPWAALDFAPPAVVGGCQPSNEWITAVADGVVARSAPGVVVLDLDGDGDERTGWAVFYLHVGAEGRVREGVALEAGAPIGHPSCEGGRTTGTHVHLARKYNGEWIPADGPLAFNLEGWVAHAGPLPYRGTLTRFTRTVTACECSNRDSQIVSEPREDP